MPAVAAQPLSAHGHASRRHIWLPPAPWVSRYGADFGTKRQLLDFLAAHLPPGRRAPGAAPMLCTALLSQNQRAAGTKRMHGSRLQQSHACATQNMFSFFFLLPPAGPAGDLRALLAAQGAEGIKLAFRPYNWTTNAAE